MDPTVKQMLDGFNFSINNHVTSLGADNPKIVRGKELMADLTAKAEGGADVSAISMDPGFSELGGLVGQLASETPLPQGQQVPASGDAASGDEVPPASIPAGGYHMAYNALPPESKEKQAKYYDRIFKIEEQAGDAITFNTMMQEDGVLLEMSREPLIESAKETLEANRKIFSPTVEHQQKATIEAYTKVGTVAELEFEGTKQAELANVEHEWDGFYIDMVGVLPACAQAIEAFGPTDENVAKLKHCYKFSPAFTGLDWEGVFEDERYLYFWNNIFWPNVPAAKRAMYRVNSAEGYRDVLKEKFFDPYIKEEPVPEKTGERKVRFWRKEYPMDDTMDLLSKPPRPDVEPQ